MSKKGFFQWGPDREGIERSGEFWVTKDREEAKKLSNEEKILAALTENGPTKYGELQKYAGVPRGSLDRVLARLKGDGTITLDAGYYGLSDWETDGSDGETDGDGDGSDGGGSDAGGEEQREPLIRLSKPKEPSGSGVTVWTPEGMITWEEHRRRKGYLD